jgi:cellulose synthase/poly-beta-1,6-N-acetylglucosamine synthase-like glycosyltransferase
MVERLIESAVHLDYPPGKLQIQVLDDSTDMTSSLVRTLVSHYQAKGLDVQLIQRKDRSGYKAGALLAGLQQASGELVAIFDADFVPPNDWLLRTVPAFEEESLGCLQTRWGHLNYDYNHLTKAQALGIDGHFVIEQTARSRNNLLLNFNGTAGIWRRAAIEDAGGWQADTLTEDLDLSYRAQLRGWRVGYLPDVVVPAELPAQIEAFKSQQFRWAKGSMQTLRKLVPMLLHSSQPWRVKLGGLVHLSGYAVHPLMLMVLLLTLPVGLFVGSIMHFFAFTSVIAFGPPLLYLMTRTQRTPRFRDRLRVLPLLILLGFGLSLNNTIAVLQGLFGKGGEFKRTPKFNLQNRQGSWIGSAYSLPHSPMVWGELGLAAYALLTIVLLVPAVGWEIGPWMMVYVAGYLYIAGLGIVQSANLERGATPKPGRGKRRKTQTRLPEVGD